MKFLAALLSAFFCILLVAKAHSGLQAEEYIPAYHSSPISPQPQPEQINVFDTSFRLTFSTAGLGSNFMHCEPVFAVRGTVFYYISRQTAGYTGGTWQPDDTLLTGYFTPAAADSVMQLLAGFSSADTSFFNPGILSGAMQSLTVDKVNYHRSVTLTNTSEIHCWRVVQLLNTFIPDGYRKLYIMFSEQLAIPK